MTALLGAARARLDRLTPHEAAAAVLEGAVVIDIRSEEERRTAGVIPGSEHHPFSVVYWRLDPEYPTSNEKLPLDTWLVIVCREGFSSSLAAATLQELGFARATDVVDGIAGWRAAGLPLVTHARRPPPGAAARLNAG